MASNFNLSLKRLLTAVLERLYPHKERAINSIRSWQHHGVIETSNQLLNNRRRDGDGSKRNTPEDISQFGISIVLYNNHDDLAKFLPALVKTLPENVSVSLFVRDNGSEKTSWTASSALLSDYAGYFNKIEIERGKNIGFGRGHNCNFLKVQEELVLVTNIDIQLEHASLSQALSIVSRDWHSNIGSWEFRQTPYEHPKHYDPVSLETAWSAHACIFIRQSAFTRIKGYDRQLFLYGEDVAFSFALRAAGYRCKYMPSCPVVHDSYADGSFNKPIMYEGVRKANLYLRIKYGLRRDNLITFFLIAVAYKNATTEERQKLKRLTRWVLTNPRFYRALFSTTDSQVMPFSEFDYEYMREGKAVAHHRGPEFGEYTVTIIIRTYAGRENLLKDALMSVKNQTVGVDNIEIIIADDGGSAKIDEGVTADFPSLKLLRCEKKGRVNSGNSALKAAKGDFIMFLDDDDLLYADHIETLYTALTADSKCLAAYGLAWEVPTAFIRSGDRRVIEREGLYKLRPHFKKSYSREALLAQNLMPIQSVLFSRKLYEEHGGFDESLELLEDWHLWCKYSLSTDFKFIPKTTSLYRVPMNSQAFQSRNTNLETVEKTMKTALAIYEADYKNTSRY